MIDSRTSALYCLVLMGLLVTASCKPRRATSPPPMSNASAVRGQQGKDPATFFDIPLGSQYTAVVQKLGDPYDDHGSGVEIPEFRLDPAGSAVIVFDMNHSVNKVFVSWADSPDGAEFTAWEGVGRIDELRSLEASGAQANKQDETRVHPRAILHAGRKLRESEGWKRYKFAGQPNGTDEARVQCLLDPHGIATGQLQEDGTVNLVRFYWWIE